MEDSWFWAAHYKDGTHLCEIDSKGRHAFAEVDQSKLSEFVLIPHKEGLSVHKLKISPTMRPIFFRRRTITVDPNTMEEKGRECVHCLGWQTTIGRGKSKRNISTYNFIFDDGTVLTSDNHDAV